MLPCLFFHGFQLNWLHSRRFLSSVIGTQRSHISPPSAMSKQMQLEESERGKKRSITYYTFSTYSSETSGLLNGMKALITVRISGDNPSLSTTPSAAVSPYTSLAKPVVIFCSSTHLGCLLSLSSYCFHGNVHVFIAGSPWSDLQSRYCRSSNFFPSTGTSPVISLPVIFTSSQRIISLSYFGFLFVGSFTYIGDEALKKKSMCILTIDGPECVWGQRFESVLKSSRPDPISSLGHSFPTISPLSYFNTG